MIRKRRQLVRNTLPVGLLTLLLASGLKAWGAEEGRAPAVLDATHPAEARVADLLGRMTFEEKMQQLRGGWPGVTAYEKTDGGVQNAAPARTPWEDSR